MTMTRATITGFALTVGQGYRLAAPMPRIMNTFFMILSIEDALPRQLPAKGFTLTFTFFLPPFLHGTEHDTTDVARTIPATVT